MLVLTDPAFPGVGFGVRLGIRVATPRQVGREEIEAICTFLGQVDETLQF